jgi:5-methylcytosine-specific restriction protein A
MRPPAQPAPFQVGEHYTRENVFDLLGIVPRPTGGNWFTGYNRHGDDWFIFAHIQSPGRTGHDYPNAWEGDLLRWYGRTGSHIGREAAGDPGPPPQTEAAGSRRHAGAG